MDSAAMHQGPDRWKGGVAGARVIPAEISSPFEGFLRGEHRDDFSRGRLRAF